MSTPAMLRPSTSAAWIAVAANCGSSVTPRAEPPRWRLLRNSPSTAWRVIAATTFRPTTMARKSVPWDSSTKAWMRMFCFSECIASSTDSADFTDSARMTPVPWLPSSSLRMTGVPPTLRIAERTSSRRLAKAVGGMPMS